MFSVFFFCVFLLLPFVRLPIYRPVDLLFLLRRAQAEIDRGRIEALVSEDIRKKRDIFVLFQEKDREQMPKGMRVQDFFPDPVFASVFPVEICPPYLFGNRYAESTVSK